MKGRSFRLLLSRRFWQRIAFKAKHCRRKIVGRIILRHFADPLQDYRSMIVVIVDVVNRTPAELNTSSDRRLENVQAIQSFSTECGDERWMDIDHSPCKVVGNQDVLQKTCHHDQLGAGFATWREHRFAVRVVGSVS